MQRLHHRRAVGVNAGFHLHRFDGQQQIARIHLLTHRDRHRSHRARHRRADMAGVGVHRLGACGGLGLDGAVGHPDHARLAVQLEEHLHFAVFRGFPHRLQPDLKRLAGVNFGGDLFAGLHAVKECPRRQGPHRAIKPVAAHVIQKDARIHQIAVQILVIDGKAHQLFGKGAAHLLKIHRRHQRAGPRRHRGLALQNLGRNRRRPTAMRLPEIAFQHIHHRFRECHVNARVFHLCPAQVLRHHHQRHVAHHF